MTEEISFNYDELSAKELKAIAKKRNDEMGLRQQDMGYIATGSKASKLVEELKASEALNAEPARNDVNVVARRVSIQDIEVHEDNYRDEKDYYDPLLVEAFVRNGGQFFGALTVVASGENKYRIISGNRSFSSYLVALEQLGMLTEGVEIDVQERIYSGTEQEQLIAEASDMGLANERQRPMSTIDKMKWYQKLASLGLSQTAIAEIHYGEENAKHQNATISIVMGYGRLPQSYQDAMHNHFHRNLYAANGEEWLEENNVPFVPDGDSVSVQGLTASNADVVCKLYPRRGDRGEAKEVQKVNDFLEANPEILTNAFSMTASAFKKYLNGLVDGDAPTEPKPQKQGPAEDDESSDTGEATAPKKEAPKKEKKEKPAETSVTVAGPHLELKTTTVQAAYELQTGEIKLSSSFDERMIDLLELDVPGALDVYKFLYYHKLLQDNI